MVERDMVIPMEAVSLMVTAMERKATIMDIHITEDILMIRDTTTDIHMEVQIHK